MAGRENGFADGVMVEDPTTRTGAVAEPTGNAVPVSIAVTVVDDMISIRVTTPAGVAVIVGFVVCGTKQDSAYDPMQDKSV